MPTEIIPFTGRMNLDDPEAVFPSGDHRAAYNARFRGNGGKMQVENIPGTTHIPFTVQTGENYCVGCFYDTQKQRVFFFNYNSTGCNGIYQYSTLTGEITPLLICNVNTVLTNDILNFDPSLPVHSIDIIYGDETMGDVLTFIDSYKRPSKINIDRAIAGDYGTFQRSYIDVAKEPHPLPPVVAYADDITATVNDLRKALFQFRVEWIFDDKEAAVMSTYSKVPLPVDPLSQAIDSDPTKNSKITVVVTTGKPNVKEIRIYARQSNEVVFSDDFLVAKLNKAEEGIADNSTYTYDFKNNVVSNLVPKSRSTHLFDWVPKKANTQAVLNGNILAYAGIVEGFDKGTAEDEIADVTLTPSRVTFNTSIHAVTAAYNWSDRVKFGLVYYDEKGRTNGVITSVDFDVSTLEYGVVGAADAITSIAAQIRHRPPTWATHYQWVRSNSLAKQKFLYWVTETTYKDTEFAYIGIENLTTYNNNIQTTTGNDIVLSYDFAQGDRIKFLVLTGVLSNKDYEILGTVIDPIVDGYIRNGRFIKIKLPTTSFLFDFGTAPYSNYFVEIYTPQKLVTDGLNTFYEFGEGYEVGEPGTFDRYHKGGTQDQSADLSTPALFTFTQGHYYIKQRTIPLGGGVYFNVVDGSIPDVSHTIGIELDHADAMNVTYETGASPLQSVTLPPFIPATNNTRWIIKTNADAYTFRLKGVMKVNVDRNTSVRIILFYSNGGSFDLIPTRTLTLGDHSLVIDKTFTVPANTRVFVMTSKSAGWINYISSELVLTNTEVSTHYAISESYSDAWIAKVNSNGRPLVEYEYGETYDPALIRYSLPYQIGTEINETNKFYPLNYEMGDRQRGDMRRLKVRGQLLRIFQSRGVASSGIFETMLSNTDGSGNLMRTDKIINKPRYYQGEYGMGNQPWGLASGSSADYFTDPVRGYQLRVAEDGITPISELYKAQYAMPPIAKRYLDDHNRNVIDLAKIIGVYDFFEEEFITVFQGGNDLTGYTLGFNEKRNAYSSFYTFDPDAILCAETTLISWLNGALYIHNNTAAYNTFYGTLYPTSVTMVVNPLPNVKKEFTAFGYNSLEGKPWISPAVGDITTAQGHRSNIVASDYDFRENIYHAAFWRDADSVGGLAEGSFLKGIWMVMKLQITSAGSAHLHGVYINYLISQKNF